MGGKTYDKKDFPVSNVRRFLEPGPIVLVSSAWREQAKTLLFPGERGAFVGQGIVEALGRSRRPAAHGALMIGS